MKVPRPKGAGAVMAAHAPAVVEADDARTALYRKLNYFPTPPWAARAGGELIQRLDPGPWSCWEPACGEGHMAHGLEDYFDQVVATDIHRYPNADIWMVLDFLNIRVGDTYPVADWIVSNPPFSKGAEFVEVGLQLARRGVAMLCRLAWFETEGRHGLFFGDAPLAVYAPFFDRLSMKLGRWEPGAGGNATAYAWFVWFTPEATPPWLDALRASGPATCAALAIPPGSKARLTHASDARLFGKARPAPLFGEVGW